MLNIPTKTSYRCCDKEQYYKKWAMAAITEDVKVDILLSLQLSKE